MVKMERYQTSDLKPAGLSIRSFVENSTIVKILLKVVGVMGVSLIISDGVLTPAQSVLGAIQGLEVVKPDITTGTIVGASCGILVLLFLIQPLGTSKIASTFAPIVIVWLLFNAVFGIYNLVLHDHSVLKSVLAIFRWSISGTQWHRWLEVAWGNSSSFYRSRGNVRGPRSVQHESNSIELDVFHVSLSSSGVHWTGSFY